VSDSGSESGSDVNAIIGGKPACIFGQIGEVIVFMEPLLDAQIQSLFKLGMMVFLLVIYESDLCLISHVLLILCHVCCCVTWHRSLFLVQMFLHLLYTIRGVTHFLMCCLL